MWEILASHINDLLQLEMIFFISVGTLVWLVVGVIPGISGSLDVALSRRDIGDNLALSRGTADATERVYYQYKQHKKLVLQ